VSYLNIQDLKFSTSIFLFLSVLRALAVRVSRFISACMHENMVRIYAGETDKTKSV